MELLKSIRPFLWGVLKRWYLIISPIILDPFDWSQVFKLSYNPPGWAIYLLFLLGLLAASFFTYHELRLKYKANIKVTWIEEYKNKYNGLLPPLPDYLVELANNYTKDKPISKSIEMITPSRQFWNNLYPSQQEKLLDLVRWLGIDPRDYISQMEKLSPPKGNSNPLKYKR
jgi:hypothetical protein